MRKMILLYNFTEERASKIRRSAFPLKIGVKMVDKADYCQPIGCMLGIKEVEPVTEDSNRSFSDEMMVMCGLNQRELDTLLRSMNKLGVRVALKAMATQTNIWWDAVELQSAIKTEHEELKRKRQG